MACFPKILRKKTGFNPSNAEIHLDKMESTVKIGKYIRREESPLIYENSKIRRRNKSKTAEDPSQKHITKPYNKKEKRAPLRPNNILPTKNDTYLPLANETKYNYQKANTVGIGHKPLLSCQPKNSNTIDSIAEASNTDNLPKTVQPKPPQAPVYLEELKKKQNESLLKYEDAGTNKVVIFVGRKQSPALQPHKRHKSGGFLVTANATPEAQVDIHAVDVEEPTIPQQPGPVLVSAGPFTSDISSAVDTANTQIIHRQRNNKSQTKINILQHNEFQQQGEHFEMKKPASVDSGVQIENNFESKDTIIEARGRVEGGVMFTRPNLSTQKTIDIKTFRKDESTRKLIRTAIEKNDFLNNYMDKDRKEMVVDAMEPAVYDEGSYIIREDEEGSEIFVSEEGYYDVIKSGNIIGTIGPGTVFGELAILYSAKRFASIKAATKVRVWKIDRVRFRNIMLVSGYKEKEEYLQFLRSSPILKDLSNEVLVKLVDLLKRRFYPGNTCIVREGEIGNEFFIIRGGSVTIKKIQPDGSERIVAHRKRGDYFGEHAILNADVRQASVYADAPVTECLKLDRETVISYLGTIPQLREKPEDKTMDRISVSRHSELNREFADIELGDLKKVATLGAGAFGRVDLVLHTSSGRTFALKILRKIDVIKQDQVEHVYSEKQVMMMCRGSPFIIQLYKTFRNDKFVYFLMEACLGGDVWTIMSKRKYFDEKTARFISGCVVEAFEFLHSRNIIYRDLKPENLMLNNDGYCKLVDFGFAKRIVDNYKTNTFAGTPEYVAPEIILDRGHDKSVDYWALGILIFELLVGKSPFRGQSQIKIYQQILGGIDVIQMPSRIPKTAQGLIKHLCKQLPAERLGCQRKGILDIKRHSWFDGFDWKKLKAKTLPSPIKRPISSNIDLQYFEPCSGDSDEPADETSGWDIDF